MSKISNHIVNSLKLYKSLGYQSIDKFDDNDVFLVGYPKSGNTWIQHLITGVLYEMEMNAANNRLIRDLVPDLHMTPYYKRYLERMCFKTHHQPKKQYRKVIYIVRDGRDAINSYYQMLNSQGKNISLSEMIQNGKHLVYGKWHEHIEAWINNPFKAEMHIVKYEDLKKQPFTEIQRICSFLNIERHPQFLEKVIENCSFGSMRKKEDSPLWDKNKKWNKDQYFVRKGEVGSYKNEVSEELIKLFEKEASNALKIMGYQ